MSNEDSQLLEYALGNLAPAELADVERQLERSPDLREQLREVRALLGTVVECTEPSAVRPEVRERLLESVRQESALEGFVVRLAELFDLGVERIRDILKSTHEERRSDWERPPAPGVELLHFAGSPQWPPPDRL
ncbi:MAG: hypothetical protein AAFN78_16720, partial [Pseudomonadota bacterium]